MKTAEIWLFIFLLGALALSWPLVAAFSGGLPAYLFTVWLLLIAAIRIFAGKASREENGG